MCNQGLEIVTSTRNNQYLKTSFVNQTRLMRKERFGSERVGTIANQMKGKTLTFPSMLSSSTSSLTSLPTLTFRKYSTWALPEMCQIKSAESSRSSQPDSKTIATYSRNMKMTFQPKRVVQTLTPQSANKNRKYDVSSAHVRDSSKTNISCPTNHTDQSCCKHSNSTTHDSQKSSVTSESQDIVLLTSEGMQPGEEQEDMSEELTAEEVQRRINIEKCLNWLAKLPDKFSGMYILQERAPVILD
uniref:Uncharacterized protein n=1 Tax=Arion vulgaris TaxID=1028688 RepID=A0A0B6YCT8_9EUPU